MVQQYRLSEDQTTNMAKKGFTLIELMIAVTIGGMIMAAAIYTGMNYMAQANRSSTRTTLQNMKVTLLNYKSEKGEYPKALQDLVKAGFLKKAVPKDAWDRAFVYRLTPDGKNPYELYSYGPKGKGGGKESRISAE